MVRQGDDRGSGTVLVLAALAVLALAALTAWTAAAAALARHRAEVAADLGALAAAGQLGAAGPEAACAAAVAVVRANLATLESCRAEGAEVVVTAAVPLRLPALLGGGSRRVLARARAGREPAPTAARRSSAVEARPGKGAASPWRYRDISGPTSAGA